MGEHDGHRQRLLAKISKDEEASVHECLEAFLFPLIPRVNTNPIAHRLLARFGTVAGIFSAPIKQLEEIEGIGHATAVYIHATGKLYPNMNTKEDLFFPQYFEKNDFSAFVKGEYELIDCEVLDVYFIDKQNRIVQRQRYTAEILKAVQLQTERVGEYLASNAASGIILVHNHPSGSSRPSIADNVATKQCEELCRLYGVSFIDHIIYSLKGVFSYRESGVLFGALKPARKGGATHAK